MGRRPNKLDRAYFEKKKDPKYDDQDAYTECCNELKTGDHMMKGNKADWKLIENHIEEHLREYTKHISVTPVSCEECGILLEYVTEIDIDKTLGFYEKAN